MCRFHFDTHTYIHTYILTSRRNSGRNTLTSEFKRKVMLLLKMQSMPTIKYTSKELNKHTSNRQIHKKDDVSIQKIIHTFDDGGIPLACMIPHRFGISSSFGYSQ
jgi:hypothetical protein